MALINIASSVIKQMILELPLVVLLLKFYVFLLLKESSSPFLIWFLFWTLLRVFSTVFNNQLYSFVLWINWIRWFIKNVRFTRWKHCLPNSICWDGSSFIHLIIVIVHVMRLKRYSLNQLWNVSHHWLNFYLGKRKNKRFGIHMRYSYVIFSRVWDNFF